MTTAVCARLICATLAAAALATGAAAFAHAPQTIPSGAEAGPLRTAQDMAQVFAPEPSPNQKPQGPINTIREVFAALEACWSPPSLDQARPGMEITVLLSFTRKGEILGRPKITYESPGASEDERLAYRIAMAEALRRCNPLPFTDGLGNALAGRPLTIRFTDNRKLKQAENVHD